MALTDTKVKNLKHSGSKYGDKHADGGGLHLLVKEKAKYWRMVYRFNGKQKQLAIGVYPAVSLKQARDARDHAKSLLAQGIDPSAAKREARAAEQAKEENSFEAVALQWYAHWRVDKSLRHVEQAMRRMKANIFPAIGHLPVTEIQAPDIVAMMKAITERGAVDLAKRMRNICDQVFRHAIAHGMAERNPVQDFKPADILPAVKTKHQPRVDGKELPALMRAINAYQGKPITRIAMLLLAHTFVRTGELRKAQWSEFDLQARRWDIPAERMKMDDPHIVPLTNETIDLLLTLHSVTGHQPLLFPSERSRGKCMSNNTILKALERMGYKGRMTGHGFRGVASTALHEMGFERAHIELQLSHQERNKVSAAYNHAQYLRKLCITWHASVRCCACQCKAGFEIKGFSFTRRPTQQWRAQHRTPILFFFFRDL